MHSNKSVRLAGSPHFFCDSIIANMISIWLFYINCLYFYYYNDYLVTFPQLTYSTQHDTSCLLDGNSKLTQNNSIFITLWILHHIYNLLHMYTLYSN